jgi:hypothetical protein
MSGTPVIPSYHQSIILMLAKRVFVCSYLKQDILKALKLERIITRTTKKTAKKYANSSLNHPLLTKEYEAYI